MSPKFSPKGIQLPARCVPWPAEISDEARQRLVALSTVPSPAGMEPDPDDKAAWREFISGVNAMILENSPPTTALGLAERQGVSCQSVIMNGVRVHVAVPEVRRPDSEHRVYLNMHGGGLVFLEGEGARREALFEAERLAVRVISIDYRVPPDHPYPAALDDCLSVYRAVLRDYRSEDVIIGGISGGGNLAASLALRIRDEGLPAPAGVVLLTPEVDLTESGDSFETLDGLDPVLPARLTRQIQLYAEGEDLRQPYLSPLFADFNGGYPPTFLQSGTRDRFLSNTVRMHRALRNAGVSAELHIWDAMPHGGFMGAPEDGEIGQELRRFLDRLWA
jgi:epsilon-lactone hydrolase